MSEGTRREWAPLLERVKAAWGELAVKGIETRHVLALRDKWSATPARTNNMLRALSSMLTWSLPRGWTRINVALDVKKLVEHDARQVNQKKLAAAAVLKWEAAAQSRKA